MASDHEEAELTERRETLERELRLVRQQLADEKARREAELTAEVRALEAEIDRLTAEQQGLTRQVHRVTAEVRAAQAELESVRESGKRR